MTATNDLGATARWAAAVRAAESEREDRLFDDPWAASLAGPEGMAWLASRPAGSLATMVLRTRFYDDELSRAAGEGIRQIVVLAAGLDTRAFRLSWPEGTVIFELDRAEVLDRKASVLSAAGAAATTDRRACPVDLTDPAWSGALDAAGFDRRRPAAFLAEGFLFYLPDPAIRSLLARVTEVAAPGSRLGADVVNALVLIHPITRGWVEMQAGLGAPWIGTVDDPVSTLDALGWDGALHQAGDPDADHGRWSLPRIPVDAPDLPHHWMVTAIRRP